MAQAGSLWYKMLLNLQFCRKHHEIHSPAHSSHKTHMENIKTLQQIRIRFLPLPGKGQKTAGSPRFAKKKANPDELSYFEMWKAPAWKAANPVPEFNAPPGGNETPSTHPIWLGKPGKRMEKSSSHDRTNEWDELRAAHWETGEGNRLKPRQFSRAIPPWPVPCESPLAQLTTPSAPEDAVHVRA